MKTKRLFFFILHPSSLILSPALLRLGLLSVVFSLWSAPASAQYNYSLNYHTNTINVVRNWIGNVETAL